MHQITNHVAMPMCDVLLHHFRKMLLYVRRYAVAYFYLLCTLGEIYSRPTFLRWIVELSSHVNGCLSISPINRLVPTAAILALWDSFLFQVLMTHCVAKSTFLLVSFPFQNILRTHCPPYNTRNKKVTRATQTFVSAFIH